MGASYLPFGPPTELKFANGTTQSLAYDARYRTLTNELTRDGIPPGTGEAGALQLRLRPRRKYQAHSGRRTPSTTVTSGTTISIA